MSAYDVEVSFAHPDPAAPGSAEQGPLLSDRRARCLPRPWRLAPRVGNEFYLLVFLVLPAVHFEYRTQHLPEAVQGWLEHTVGAPGAGLSLGQLFTIVAMVVALVLALWAIKRATMVRAWVRTVPMPETAPAAVAELEHFDLDARFPLTRAVDWLLDGIHWLRHFGQWPLRSTQNARETVMTAPIWGAGLVVFVVVFGVWLSRADVATWVFVILLVATTVALLVRAWLWGDIDQALNQRSQALMTALSRL